MFLVWVSPFRIMFISLYMMVLILSMTSAKSMFFNSVSMPSSLALSMVLTSSAGYISILDGMQPRVRQMPPGSSLSMTAIFTRGLS